jgi:carbonic anhydrase
MQDLLRGIKRFRRTAYPQLRSTFEQLESGQSPPTLFITCSDSRIDPHLITQTLPGQLFILRNAGNLVPEYRAGDEGSAGTIEYAAAVLGVKHIVICGHSNCGAMHAILHPESLDGLPAVHRWLRLAESTRRAARDAARTLEGEELSRYLITRNVLLQLDNIAHHPSVERLLRAGEVELHGWVFDIGTASFSVWDPPADEFLSLDEE